MAESWTKYIGNTYALTCAAFNSDADQVNVSGEYVAMEYESADPDAGTSAAFYVQPPNTAEDDFDAVLVIDESDFIRCADPALWAKWAEQDAMAESVPDDPPPVNCPDHAAPAVTRAPASSEERAPIILHCEIGNHDWTRPPTRGKAPRNCPEHKPAVSALALTPETLHCVLGNHDWSRENRRGRAPANCPEHRPIKATRDPDTVSSTKRIEAIQSIIDERDSCTCALRADMTDRELMRLRTCTESDGNGYGRGWVCSTTDKIRRLYVDYGALLASEPAYSLD